MDAWERDFEAGWARHQCEEIVRLRNLPDQDREVMIWPLLWVGTVRDAAHVIEDKVIEVAERLMQ